MASASLIVPALATPANRSDEGPRSSFLSCTHLGFSRPAQQMQVLFDKSGSLSGHSLPERHRITMAWGGALASIRLIIQGKNLELTESLKAYVEDKVGKAIHNHSYLVMKVDVRLSIRGGESGKGQKLQRCEVTMFTKKHGVVRAEVETDSMYSAIDNVSDVITRKLRKIKERDGQGKKLPLPLGQMIARANAAQASKREELQADYPDEEQIVRKKYFDMPPVKTSDALAYMSNVGHDFYAFRNAESGQVNILYKRKEGGFGIIIPTDEDSDGALPSSGQ